MVSSPLYKSDDPKQFHYLYTETHLSGIDASKKRSSGYHTIAEIDMMKPGIISCLVKFGLTGYRFASRDEWSEIPALRSAPLWLIYNIVDGLLNKKEGREEAFNQLKSRWEEKEKELNEKIAAKNAAAAKKNAANLRRKNEKLARIEVKSVLTKLVGEVVSAGRPSYTKSKKGKKKQPRKRRASDLEESEQEESGLASWVQCDHCEAWHQFPSPVEKSSLPHTWHCGLITWAPLVKCGGMSCDRSINDCSVLETLPANGPGSGTAAVVDVTDLNVVDITANNGEAESESIMVINENGIPSVLETITTTTAAAPAFTITPNGNSKSFADASCRSSVVSRGGFTNGGIKYELAQSPSENGSAKSKPSYQRKVARRHTPVKFDVDVISPPDLTIVSNDSVSSSRQSTDSASSSPSPFIIDAPQL